MQTTDLYTKSILTIIAICLCLLVFQNIELIPSANADNQESIQLQLPLNADGSLNVYIKGMDEVMDINLDQINGYNINGSAIPIKTDDEIDVNIEEVGGYSVSRNLPVEEK